MWLWKYHSLKIKHFWDVVPFHKSGRIFSNYKVEVIHIHLL